MHGDVMQMQAVEGGLIIPANGVVHLEPGGLHLMFHDIDAPFVDGQSVPLAMTFEHAGEVTTLLPVRVPTATNATPAAPAHAPAH
jgi:copper(I)-binding protein